MVEEDGHSAFGYLASLALTILLLLHGNSDPECGFSVNNNLLEKHSTNIAEDTLKSIRIIKNLSHLKFEIIK